jgi:transposase-like protein
VKVGGKWHYLYPAIDRDGNLVDSVLSATSDVAAAKQFFQQATDVTGCRPERVTSNRHDSYARAILRVLGRTVPHRTTESLHNRIEQDQRTVAQSETALLQEIAESATVVGRFD